MTNVYQDRQEGPPVIGQTRLDHNKIYIGDADNKVSEVLPNGDVTISDTGSTAISADVIVDADVNSAAAILKTKLVAGTGNEVAIHDIGGFLTSEATLAKVRGGSGQDNSSLTFPASGTILTDATGANVSLSNLSAVAINTSLLPAITNTIDLGGTGKVWNILYAGGVKNSSTNTAVINLNSWLLLDSTEQDSINFDDRTLIDSANNTSVDYENRRTEYASGATAIDWNSTTRMTFQAASYGRSESSASANYVEEIYIDGVTLTANTTTTVHTYTQANFSSYVVDYSMTSAGEVRTGTFKIANKATATVNYDDVFVQTADVNITLTADINSTNIRIRAANAHATNNCTMRLDIKRFRA